jgi:hypothetical protein
MGQGMWAAASTWCGASGGSRCSMVNGFGRHPGGAEAGGGGWKPFGAWSGSRAQS